MPALLAGLILAGLITALAGDGWWDIGSCLVLLYPLLLILKHYFFPAKATGGRDQAMPAYKNVAEPSCAG